MKRRQFSSPAALLRQAFAATVLLLLAALPAYARFGVLSFGAAPAASAYTDFCSQAGITCADAFSVRGRLVSSNTSPGTLTRFSDGATHTVVYTGANFKVNVADATSFCTGNGGTTTTLTYTTQYNDCGWSTIVSQTGSGCNPTQATGGHIPYFQVRLADGESAIAQASAGPATGAGIRWLYASGCTGVAGTGAKSLIVLTSNAYFSVCCGEFGPGEAPVGITSGSMFAGMLYTSAGLHYWFIDGEGGGTCASASTISASPVVDAVAIGTFGGAGNPLSNYWYNNTQTCTNSALGTPPSLNTQQGMNIGCSGDHTSCGPYFLRDMITIASDVSATGGLPAQIYSYMSAL